MDIDFENDFEIDIEALVNILATRDRVWPYCVDYFDQPQTVPENIDLESWLKDNCKHEYRIFRGLTKKQIQFINEQDFVLFQMIWG